MSTCRCCGQPLPLRYCERCGDPITGQGRKYCGHRCQEAASRDRHRTKINADNRARRKAQRDAAKLSAAPRHCAGCGTPLDPLKPTQADYCTPECAKAAYRKRNAKRIAEGKRAWRQRNRAKIAAGKRAKRAEATTT
jgi:predicted nucleic acid-binding Zn ribbon protein